MQLLYVMEIVAFIRDWRVSTAVECRSVISRKVLRFQKTNGKRTLSDGDSRECNRFFFDANLSVAQCCRF